MSIAGDLIRGHTDAIILARLIQSDSYGYEINKVISTLSAGRFELKEATLYTAFKRLEELGYIASYWGGSGAGAHAVAQQHIVAAACAVEALADIPVGAFLSGGAHRRFRLIALGDLFAPPGQLIRQIPQKLPQKLILLAQGRPVFPPADPVRF